MEKYLYVWCINKQIDHLRIGTILPLSYSNDLVLEDARLFHGIIHLDHDGVHVHARDYARALQDLNVYPYVPNNMPVYIPLKRSSPIIFPLSPAHAVISTSLGFVIGSGETKR